MNPATMINPFMDFLMVLPRAIGSAWRRADPYGEYFFFWLAYALVGTAFCYGFARLWQTVESWEGRHPFVAGDGCLIGCLICLWAWEASR